MILASFAGLEMASSFFSHFCCYMKRALFKKNIERLTLCNQGVLKGSITVPLTSCLTGLELAA
jgi:hypothetical protein